MPIFSTVPSSWCQIKASVFSPLQTWSTNGGDTITTHDPAYQSIIGSTTILSYKDSKWFNEAYHCSSHCPATSCPPGGYLDQHCVCQCDSGDRFNPIVPCGGGPSCTMPEDPCNCDAAACSTIPNTICDSSSGACVCQTGYVLQGGNCVDVTSESSSQIIFITNFNIKLLLRTDWYWKLMLNLNERIELK